MDFSVSGSDSWETTAAQETFILNYFQEQKLPVSSKTLKKKRKREQDTNLLGDYQHHQKNKKLMKLPIEKNSKATEMDSMAKIFPKHSKKKLKRQIKDIPEFTVSTSIPKSHKGSLINHDFSCTENKTSKKLKNVNKNLLILDNKKLKMELSKKNVTPAFQENESLLLELNSPPKNSKKNVKKAKNFLELNEDLNLERNESVPHKPNSSPKKVVKKTKKILELNEDLNLEQNESLLSNSSLKNSQKRVKKTKKLLELNEDLNLERNESLLLEPKLRSKISKKKKSKKSLKLNEDLDLKPNKSFQLEPNSVPKKKKSKKIKKSLELDEDLDIEEISEDSFHESDEELVSEIQNSEVFKEIREFMKQSSLPSNLKDSNESVGELSTDNSGESFDELSAKDSDDSSSEVESVANTIKVPRKVKESSELPKNQTSSSGARTNNANDNCLPDKVSNDYIGLKLHNDAKSLVHNVNSKMQTVSSSLKNKAWEKLKAAKFRYLNEKLYTETGESAFHYFQENVEEYHDYHQGYSLQVSKWPMNPVSKIISDLQNLKENIVVADMGCGDAKIARTLTNVTVHSYDIIALNEFVKACDISKVPLSNESVDVVVFCLSLMGTNLKDYLIEAHRLLKMGGTLKIAEVESRIDVNSFVKSLKSLGFSLQKQDLKHKVFVFLDFKKEKKKVKKASIPSITMRPCLYKKR